MLDDVTKKRINTLRQILVGKLPDPKAQVEQITNGLIYKFMNDMDEESISMGGKSTYFSGKYQKYSWKNLLDTKTSGIEKLSLYSEAIEQMYNNENLPELFREIFKNSFLPFKDPSTLNMFLKEINEFHYSNSEKLGDAFEYLLSFMGSQGDAGQFRTPRHIIDFIVEVVNPQKNETILDPACGTAGFLISSYKHILKQNTKKNLGDKLTASDRKKIGENLNGYDISPDMVKMSLVNMYLHKFTNPKINEYDTLSSEDRWNEYYDVILANPPFFSPKGGIMPHNRFGVKSTKAEVLFVDYINEHLKPNGRAGIIVPEGIIFQKGDAYKQLRKKLLETSLIGVISLPSGVFNPYANVKTSILILDKKKAKESDYVHFANIQNDGFDLGSQRREVKENDLPVINNYFQKILNNSNYKFKEKNFISLEKKLLISNQIISFNYDEYQGNEEEKSNYDLKELNELIKIKYGTRVVKKSSVSGNYPVYGGGDKTFYINEYNRENELIIARFGISEHCVRYIKDKFYLNDSGFSLEIKNKNLNPEYLNKILLNIQSKIFKCARGVGQKNVNIDSFLKIKIPLPNLNTQNQIAKELDSYQKIIDGCKQVIENYKPSIDIEPSWEGVKLGEITELIKRGITPKYIEEGGTVVLNQRCIRNHSILYEFSKRHNHKEKKISDEKYLKSGDVLVNSTGVGTLGRVAQYIGDDNKITVDSHLTIVRPKKNIFFDEFFGISMIMAEDIISESGEGTSGQTELSRETLSKIKIYFPKSLDKQKEISKNINLERETIDRNNLLIKTYKKKIEDKINKIWCN